ncbi:hypothetical protein NC651_028873 [Populus alba x Populus x berolinensis]|nr:hypothetical protein NC651_028873 [Populus alba x Populus x berolinensis]
MEATILQFLSSLLQPVLIPCSFKETLIPCSLEPSPCPDISRRL